MGRFFGPNRVWAWPTSELVCPKPKNQKFPSIQDYPSVLDGGFDLPSAAITVGNPHIFPFLRSYAAIPYTSLSIPHCPRQQYLLTNMYIPELCPPALRIRRTSKPGCAVQSSENSNHNKHRPYESVYLHIILLRANLRSGGNEILHSTQSQTSRHCQLSFFFSDN